MTRINRITLDVGELRNIQEDWMQKYFMNISPGTPAEGATIKINKIPLIFHCEDCNKSYHPNARDKSTFACPTCRGENYDMVSGYELLVKNIEVE